MLFQNLWNLGNDVIVELPSDWCFNKFRGYGTCVVFKRRKPGEFIRYHVKDFDGASLRDCFPYNNEEYLEGYEVKDCGARVVCDEDTNLSMLQDLPNLSYYGGAFFLAAPCGDIRWSCYKTLLDFKDFQEASFSKTCIQLVN
ncbi:hypothetical protein Tco_1181479, partial [Tanacetum coccineum]